MGGGTTRLFPKRNRDKENGTPSLFHYDSDNVYSTTGQSTGFIKAEYASDKKPESYLGDTEYGETIVDTFTLFLVIFYFLKEKFGTAKNKKLRNYLDKLEELITNRKDSLINCSEFKNFQKYCINKPIQQYHGYEVVRRFLTKHFSDSSGIFMRLKKDEWVQYVDRFLKK
jgi:hypothetical protein